MQIKINESEFPEKLYRWIPKEYKNDFLLNGDFFITTLYSCRNLENSKRTDETEGKVTLFDSIGYKNTKTKIPFILKMKMGMKLKMGNFTWM